MSKFDVQHSDASFQHLSSSDLVDSVTAMDILSTYHKRNHYLLNNGAKGYNPPSWSDVDNIFPDEAPVHPMTHLEWAAGIRTFDPDNTKGDVLEFGVACAGTIRDISPINASKTIYGFDHFKGLEQTKQETPDYAGWYKGAFRLEGSEYRQTYDRVLEDCAQFPNITLIVKDIHELDEPSAYGITKISAVHIDVDIYEPTVSSLNFVDKCEWDEIYMRFDDWHGHEPDYDQHERLACKEWIDRNGYGVNVMRNGLHGELIVTRNK
tara:strand:- start:587 stop:1381 length:795 start_codon:yes stop_codon:yes gene_type:complete